MFHKSMSRDLMNPAHGFLGFSVDQDDSKLTFVVQNSQSIAKGTLGLSAKYYTR